MRALWTAMAVFASFVYQQPIFAESSDSQTLDYERVCRSASLRAARFCFARSRSVGIAARLMLLAGSEHESVEAASHQHVSVMGWCRPRTRGTRAGRRAQSSISRGFARAA